MLSNMISSGMASSVPSVQTTMSGPSGVTATAGSMPVSSTGQVTTHNSSPASLASATPNVPGNSSLQPSSTIQSAQLNYAKAWEGNLYGKRQGQPVLLTRLEGYRRAKASDTLSADWPSSMEIVRLISQDHMYNKQYVEKGDFLVFRAMDKHAFFEQLQEKKLCAVIRLPTQTLLLSVSDKVYRLIGVLFPGVLDFSKRPMSISTTASTSTSATATATATETASTNAAATITSASTKATTKPGGAFMN